jgi:hypothetical protein
MTEIVEKRGKLDHDRSLNLDTDENTKLIEHIKQTNGIVCLSKLSIFSVTVS